MPLSRIPSSSIPPAVPGFGSRPSLGRFASDLSTTSSLPTPPLHPHSSSSAVSTPASPRTSYAFPPTPPPTYSAPLSSFWPPQGSTSTGKIEGTASRAHSSSTLTLTFSAHTSIPESTCVNPHITAHPFSHPFEGVIASDAPVTPDEGPVSVYRTTKRSSSSPKRVIQQKGEVATAPEDLEEDDWYFFRARSSTSGYHQLTDVSNAGGDEEQGSGNDSLLLFRERQRRYYWLKQVREAQRRKKRALEEVEGMSDSTTTPTPTTAMVERGRKSERGRGSGKRVRMDVPEDVDVEMERARTVTPPPGVYSRTLNLRSPSPTSSASSSRDVMFSMHRRERSSGKGSATAAFWGRPEEQGSRASTPAPSSTASAAVAGPGPRTMASGGEGNRLGSPPTNAAPAIQVNGVTVVKATAATSAVRPRGLWRSRTSGPVPTLASTQSQTQGTQIGGFVFGSHFLAGSSLHLRPPPVSTAASASTSGRHGRRPPLERASSSSSTVYKRTREDSDSESELSSTSSCSSESESEEVGPSGKASTRKTSSAPSSHGRLPQPSTAPTKSFDYTGKRDSGAVSYHDTRRARHHDHDDEDDLEAREHKRKQGPQPATQHKRRRTDPEVQTATSTPSSTPMETAVAKEVVPGKSEKYVTRSKLMDTGSLATVNPAVIASRKERANPTVTKVDSSTSTDPSSPPSARPRSPSEYPFPPMNQPRIPLVTLDDWEDLKELWNRCLEVVDTEDPEEVLPLLRGIIHECSWFLQEYEDPSVIFMTPRKVTTPISPPIPKTDSDVDTPMSGASTPPFSATRPKGPSSNASSYGSTVPRHQHHHLCQHHETNRHRPHTNDLPTAFHSLLGTALFLFGNIIGANPELALEGEPTTSTVYHLYALDVFEVGESLPSKTLVGRHDGSPTSPNAYSGSDVGLAASPGPYTPECCAQGMKEDWQMAVTWGRALVSLAEDLLDREKIVEARQQAVISHAAASNPGHTAASYQLHHHHQHQQQQPYENPAGFLSEDFCIPTFMHGGGYFAGTGGQGMGLTLNGAGVFVPTGTGVGGSLSAFHSPVVAGANPGSAEDYWTAGATAVAQSEAAITPGSTSSHLSTTYASSSSSGSSTTTIASLANTPVASAAPRLPALPDRHLPPQSMYPSSSFLSPSFIAAASSQEAFGGGQISLHTPLATPTGNTPGAHTDPRRLWAEESPFVVIRSRMPPVTRRMSLGVGAGTSVDEMMTLAVDQFSRGIFHMPKAVGEGGEEVVSPGVHGVGGQRRLQHHHQQQQKKKRQRSRHSPKEENLGGTPGGTAYGVPASFSRASHLYTIAVQVLLLAEKITEPESRYKWGRYADSVFGQMRLEESPVVEVVSVQSESLVGALNAGAGEEMDVDVDVGGGERGEGSNSSRQGEGEERGQQMHRHRHGHHHKHTHGHHRQHPSEGSGVKSVVGHHPYLFLNNNSNPDILKARGRCALLIGGARAEASVEGPLEEVLNDERSGEREVEENVKRILQGEDAEEARERLEEAVKLLERAREVWRRDVWGPRKKAMESARRKRGRAERERVEAKEREREEKEKEKKRKERADAAQADMQKKRDEKQVEKSRENKLGKVKRRGIGRVAADNKRASRPTPTSPASSSSSHTPTYKGKERATASTSTSSLASTSTSAVFPTTPSEVGTPQEEVAAVMRVLQSPDTEYPPVSPEASGSSGGSDSSRAQAVVVSAAAAAASSSRTMTDYFPPTAPLSSSVPSTVEDEEAEEKVFRVQEEEEESEEVDLAQLLAEAYVTLAELQVGKEEKLRLYKRAKEEARRAGKEGIVEEELEGMNVD